MRRRPYCIRCGAEDTEVVPAVEDYDAVPGDCRCADGQGCDDPAIREDGYELEGYEEE